MTQHGQLAHEALWESTKRVERESGGVKGAKWVASALGIPQSTFYQMCEGIMHIKAEQVPLIHRICGPEVIQALCALCDGTFRPNAQAAETEAIVLRELPRLLHEQSQYIGAVTRALADGTITQAEAREIRKEYNDMMNAAAQFAAVLDATARESRHNGRHARTLAEADQL